MGETDERLLEFAKNRPQSGFSIPPAEWQGLPEQSFCRNVGAPMAGQSTVEQVGNFSLAFRMTTDVRDLIPLSVLVTYAPGNKVRESLTAVPCAGTLVSAWSSISRLQRQAENRDGDLQRRIERLR